MTKNFLMVTITGIFLTACATTPPDPTLVNGVKRYAGGMYSISELGMFAGGDLTSYATRQCELDGNKKLKIEGTTTKTGVTGTAYPVMLFRCE